MKRKITHIRFSSVFFCQFMHVFVHKYAFTSGNHLNFLFNIFHSRFSHAIAAFPNSDTEFEIAEIIFGLLQILQFNAHEVFETVRNPSHMFNGTKTLYIAVALYNSAAYFNHHCYPAVVRYFVGKSIVLCASHPLEAGDVVAENYGPIFTRQPLAERQRQLRSRYWFFCECISCKENWPTLDQLNDKVKFR